MTESDAATALLDKLTPEVRALVQQLRPVIKDVLPSAVEKVYLGWSALQYSTSDKMSDMVLALSPHASYVNLEFADGIDLPDPAHRLEGTGKRMRHVKVRSAEDVASPEVRALLQAAAQQRGI